MEISEFQFKRALEKLKFHEEQAEAFKKITKAYIYQEESKRVEQRKIDSDKYHAESLKKS